MTGMPEESAGDAAFPSFADIVHPTFPEWMLAGLDRLLAREPRIERIHFDLWATSYYDDNTNHEFKGTAIFQGAPAIPQEDLDENPAVRMFERRADEFWELLPISIDDDENVSINGEYSFHAERGRVAFTYTTDRDLCHQMMIEAVHDGESWKSVESITFFDHEGVASDLLAQDPQAVLSTYDTSELMLDEMPRAIAVSAGTNGEVTVILENGELTRCMATR